MECRLKVSPTLKIKLITRYKNGHKQQLVSNAADKQFGLKKQVEPLKGP